MRTNRERVLTLFIILLLVTLFVLQYMVQKPYQNLLLMIPRSQGTAGHTAQQLEDFIKEEFTITYEIPEQWPVSVTNSSYTANVIGTNCYYAQILGYPLLAGSFFSPNALKERKRQVVLNKTAAYRWFGSRNISGNTIEVGNVTWIVTGVIDDGDEDEMRMYAPASLVGGSAQTLMALMDGETVSEAYAMNAFKKLGIQEKQAYFINLERLTASFGERIRLSCYVILGATLMRLLWSIMQRLRDWRNRYREQLSRMYWGQLWKHSHRSLLEILMLALAFVAVLGAVSMLAIRVLEIVLRWKDLLPTDSGWYAGAFAAKLTPLYYYFWADMFVFIVLFLLLLAGGVLCWVQRKGALKHQERKNDGKS